jgi:hypothetical protein
MIHPKLQQKRPWERHVEEFIFTHYGTKYVGVLEMLYDSQEVLMVEVLELYDWETDDRLENVQIAQSYADAVAHKLFRQFKQE